MYRYGIAVSVVSALKLNEKEHSINGNALNRLTGAQPDEWCRSNPQFFYAEKGTYQVSYENGECVFTLLTNKQDTFTFPKRLISVTNGAVDVAQLKTDFLSTLNMVINCYRLDAVKAKIFPSTTRFDCNSLQVSTEFGIANFEELLKSQVASRILSLEIPHEVVGFIKALSEVVATRWCKSNNTLQLAQGFSRIEAGEKGCVFSTGVVSVDYNNFPMTLDELKKDISSK